MQEPGLGTAPATVQGVRCSSEEKRHSQRLKVCCKMEIIALAARYGTDIRPALSVDLSPGGACVNTPHDLCPEEEVEVVIHTDVVPDLLGLPEELRGRARVRRVDNHEGGWRRIALAFSPGLSQSMEMAMFLAFLYGAQQGVTLA